MSDSFYHITEFSELSSENKRPKHLFGHVLEKLEFLRRVTSLCKHMYSAINDVMKSFLTRM